MGQNIIGGTQMRYLLNMLAAFSCIVTSTTVASTSTTKPERPTVDADGTIHLPAFSVPLSRYMSEEAKRQFIEEAQQRKVQWLRYRQSNYL
jgi:hypothetical protein